MARAGKRQHVGPAKLKAELLEDLRDRAEYEEMHGREPALALLLARYDWLEQTLAERDVTGTQQ